MSYLTKGEWQFFEGKWSQCDIRVPRRRKLLRKIIYLFSHVKTSRDGWYDMEIKMTETPTIEVGQKVILNSSQWFCFHDIFNNREEWCQDQRRMMTGISSMYDPTVVWYKKVQRKRNVSRIRRSVSKEEMRTVLRIIVQSIFDLCWHHIKSVVLMKSFVR